MCHVFPSYFRSRRIPPQIFEGLKKSNQHFMLLGCHLCYHSGSHVECCDKHCCGVSPHSFQHNNYRQSWRGCGAEDGEWEIKSQQFSAVANGNITHTMGCKGGVGMIIGQIIDFYVMEL